MISDQLIDVDLPYQALPHGADLRVAIRRTVRVGENAGDVVEDLGVRPDYVYEMTRQDVLGNNENLLATAIKTISDRAAHTIEITIESLPDLLPRIKIKTQNVDRIDATINTRQIRSLYPQKRLSHIELQDEISDLDEKKVLLQVKGYKSDKLVVQQTKSVLLD